MVYHGQHFSLGKSSTESRIQRICLQKLYKHAGLFSSNLLNYFKIIYLPGSSETHRALSECWLTASRGRDSRLSTLALCLLLCFILEGSAESRTLSLLTLTKTLPHAVLQVHLLQGATRAQLYYLKARF